MAKIFKSNVCMEWQTKLVSLFQPPNHTFGFGLPTFPTPDFTFGQIPTNPFPLSTLQSSPAFEFLGSTWYLKITKNPLHVGGFLPDVYKVSLVPTKVLEGETSTPCFSVGTCVRHPTDSARAPVCWQWREKVTNGVEVEIWSLSSTDMFKELDWIRQLDEVKFVFMFYGAGHKIDYVRPVTDEKGIQVSSQVPRDVESLSSDLSRLLDKEILSDVTLKCGDQNFQAHRSVLVARSDVFRAMFQPGTLESKTGEVTIQDMDVHVLEKLLKFVYTGELENIPEGSAADMYEAADKYAVHSLKTACSYWIERNLTVDNCVKYLKVADSHSDCDLKRTLVSFAVENPGVLKSEAWLTFVEEPSKLAMDVLQAYVAKVVQ